MRESEIRESLNMHVSAGRAEAIAAKDAVRRIIPGSYQQYEPFMKPVN